MIPAGVVSRSMSIGCAKSVRSSASAGAGRLSGGGFLDRAGQIEAADAADGPAPAETLACSEPGLRQQRGAGGPSLRQRPALDLHRELIAAGRHASRQVGGDRADPRLGMGLLAARLMDLPADGVLVVDVRGALALQARDLALQPRLLHQPSVTRGDRLGHGELVGLAAGILDAADACGRPTAPPR